MKGKSVQTQGRVWGKGIIKVKFSGGLCILTMFFLCSVMDLAFYAAQNLKSSTLIIIAEV